VETGPTSPPGEGFFSFISIQGMKELSEKGLMDTLAHEIAHQWGGNRVKFEGPGETWFPEGLATHSSNLYYSMIKNDSYIIDLALENCIGLPIGEFGKEIPLSNLSIYSDIRDNEDPRLDQILIYQKSAVVFHMLRYIIGNEDFFSLLHDLVSSYQDSNCTLSDFINESEKISKMNLNWFFNEWVFSTDNLDYYIEGVESNKKDD
jgi:aminopeptidase N